MCDNIENCCRICLDVESDHISILDDATVNLHLKSCLAITVSPQDELPRSICVSCMSQLSEFYNFQLNARCSQDWLESSVQEKSKKSTEKVAIVQPLPDSEYNSDSLLEFLNNTANIEEYLNNLGKEDIPSIVNMLDRNHENSMDGVSKVLVKPKQPSPKKKEITVKQKNCAIKMEIDVLDSDIDIVKEILMKEPKKNNTSKDKYPLSCFACKIKFDNIQKLSQHLIICDSASRTCFHCNTLFDSKQKMQQHSVIHNAMLTCNCGKQFPSKDKLAQHHKICHIDYAATMGCVYRCKQCNLTFKERFLLYRHAKEHVLKAEERICDICGHGFIGNDALVKHRMQEHGRPNGLLYKCKICDETSPSHKDMFLHVQKHTEKPDLDRHLCETCGSSFASRTTLLRHLQLHGNVGHRCNVCNKSFGDVKERDKHILEHIEMVMCEKCGESVSSCKLEEHLCVM